MEIDANGTVSEAGARGDFRAGHAFDEAEDERLAVGFGERANGVEDGVGFGAGVGSGVGGGRRLLVLRGREFFVEFVVGFDAAVKVCGAVARDGGKPAGEFGGFAKRTESRQGLEENVLDEVVHIGMGDAREKNAVDHADVAGVEKAEGGAVTLLGGADQGVVGAGVIWESAHGRETGAGGMEFEECGHVGSIEKKDRLP
jgi:hypothetical protein